jgi:hypothetical protein
MQEIFSWDFILFHVHASGKGRINNKIKRNGVIVLATQWFSPGLPVPSTSKTESHHIT